MNIPRRKLEIRRWMVYLLLLLILLFVAFYYRQVWRIFSLGPRTWLLENSTLATFLSATWQLVTESETMLAFPAFSDAFGRFWRALFGSGTLLIAAWTSGVFLLYPLRNKWSNWRLALLCQTSIGLGLIAYGMLLLAYAQLYTPPVVRLLVMAIAASGVLLLLRKARHVNFSSFFHKRRIQVRSATTIWKLIAVVAVGIAFIGALAPEIEWDSLWYHLWIPEQWLEIGRPYDNVDEYISLYPFTVELLFGAAMTLGGYVAAKLIHFAFLPLGILLVYEISRTVIPHISPWLPVALFATVPTLLWEATTAYVDLAVTVYVGLAMLLLMLHIDKRQRRWLLLAAITLGLALATKHLSLVVLAIVAPGLLVLLWQRDRDLKRALWSTIAFTIIALLIPSPWYLRAWLASGNPFFPDLYTVFGATPPLRWNDLTETGLQRFKDQFGVDRSLVNLLLLPWHVTVNAYRFGGNLGPVFFILMFGLVLRPIESNPWLKWIALFIVGYLLFWASPVSSFQLRFLLPLTPWLAVLAAEGYSRIVHALPNRRPAKMAATVCLTGLLLLNLPIFTSLHEGNEPAFADWVTHVIRTIPLGVVVGHESEQQYLARNVPTYTAWQHVDATVPHDAVLLTFAGGDHLYATRSRYRDSSARLIGDVWLTDSEDVDLVRRRFTQVGITHILYDKSLLAGDLDGLAVAEPALVSNWDRPLFEDELYVLFALQPWDVDDE